MKLLLPNALAWSAALFLVTPLLWVIAVALTDGNRPTIGHFRRLFADYPVARWLANSLLMAGSAAPVAVVLCSAAGYALAKLRFTGRSTLTWLLLAMLLLPAHALLPAAFELVLALGLIDSYAAVILPAAASAFGVLLYRQAMRGVDDDVLDAARLDGAGEIRLWWSLALPAVRPVTAAFTLFAFLGVWNSFLWPAVVLGGERQPLAVGMTQLVALPESQANPGPLMAAVLLGAAVPILLFLGVQRDLEEGLAGAIRG